jgi:hypothetical protein
MDGLNTRPNELNYNKLAIFFQEQNFTRSFAIKEETTPIQLCPRLRYYHLLHF